MRPAGATQSLARCTRVLSNGIGSQTRGYNIKPCPTVHPRSRTCYTCFVRVARTCREWKCWELPSNMPVPRVLKCILKRISTEESLVGPVKPLKDYSTIALVDYMNTLVTYSDTEAYPYNIRGFYVLSSFMSYMLVCAVSGLHSVSFLDCLDQSLCILEWSGNVYFIFSFACLND